MQDVSTFLLFTSEYFMPGKARRRCGGREAPERCDATFLTFFFLFYLSIFIFFYIILHL